MIEVKARLYDIAEELEGLEKKKAELVRVVKAKAMELDSTVLQPVLAGKALELNALIEELIETIRKIKTLNEERLQLKNKLEVLND